MVATATELEHAISDLVQSLQRGIQVEAVVLYGSYAHGAPHEGSDIDLAVISPDFEGVPLSKRQDMIARLSVHRYPNLAPIGYPSNEYHNPGRHSFLREVLRTGRVVYPAG
jgi:predicted nucleotidyltransferase